MSLTQYFIATGTELEQRKKGVSDWKKVELEEDLWFKKYSLKGDYMEFFDPEIAEAVGRDWNGCEAQQYRVHKKRVRDDVYPNDPIRGSGQSRKPGSHRS